MSSVLWCVGLYFAGRSDGALCSRRVGVMRRLGASLRAAVRSQHHRHIAAVLLGGRLHEAVVGDVGATPLQQPVPEFGPRLLASAEHDGHLDFRPRLQEADHVALLGLVVVRVDLGSQLLFLDDGLLLILARLACLLSRLVLELAVVHDLADRRFGVRRYFDKVEIGIRGDAEGVFDAHNANLLATWSDQADFRYSNALIDAGLSADGASYVVLEPNTISRKALLKAGPKADQDRHRMPVTGPLCRYGQRWEWDSTCCPWRTPGRSRVPV